MKYIYESLSDAPKAPLNKHFKKRLKNFIKYGAPVHAIPGTTLPLIGLGIARTVGQVSTNCIKRKNPMHKVMIERNFYITPHQYKKTKKKVVEKYQKYKDKLKSFTNKFKKSDENNNDE